MITYFYRNKNVGFSIGTVFKTISNELVKKSVEITEVYMPSERSMPWNSIHNGYFTWKHRNRDGINHITGHIHEVILGLLGCKVVLTIHDLVFLDNIKNPLKRLYKWFFWLYIPIKLADKVVCISTHTKNNILKHISANNLCVIYNPVDPNYIFYKQAFNHQKPTILHIGTGWNKNLNRVIEALSDINCHLRIIGRLSPEQKELLENSKLEYSNAYHLTDLEIRKEYKNCDMVSFPSEYEGFGMPVIEGQKTGRVVLTSKIEPLIEVAKDSVCYVNPLDVVSIREGFLKVMHDNKYRNELIRKGNINVARFSVEQIAQEYLDVYKSILK